jgi:arylformamidase
MKIIDLTLPLYNAMPVYPGDPEVEIEQVHFLEKDGWNLSTISIPSHIGTHVNVPWHMVAKGKTIGDYSISDFLGKAERFISGMSMDKNTGVIFTEQNIDKEIAQALIKQPPKFIGLSDQFEFDVELERLLLVHNIISFENLANTDKLPTNFEFYGVPLRIKDGDGSPVRAFAIV